jgi:2-pyrone-4,6-dicarboxylate lactonase
MATAGQTINEWMMVSNGNPDSKMDAVWDDAIPYGKAFIEAAPDRMIWGNDWPHPQWTKPMMNDAKKSSFFTVMSW